MPIYFSNLSFIYPAAPAPVLHDVTAAFSARVIGLVGNNGSGKSTLLRLISGDLQPTSGLIKTPVSLGYLPQDIVRYDQRTIADLLGITPVLTALAAVEGGSVDPKNYDVIGGDWDIAERAQALLAQQIPSLGNPADLQRKARTLSGGEILRVALQGLRLRGFNTVLLDEPTNNLDSTSRAEVYEQIRSWRGQLVVVSHDLELLSLVDEIAELRDGKIRLFQGNYAVYKQSLELEQAAVERDVADAKREKRFARQTRIEAEIRLNRAVRAGKKAKEQRKFPHKQAGLFASGQQESQGKLRRGLEESAAQAQAHLDEAQAKLRDDDTVVINLPDPHLGASRDIAEIYHPGGTIYLRGAERISIAGDNGSGKTTLLRTFLGEPRNLGVVGVAKVERIGYLSQKIDNLPAGTVFEVVKAAAPTLDDGQVRNQLARLLIRGDQVFAPVDTLSGGERFRVALAGLLLHEPAYQLLLLDEPTNNLDIATKTIFIEALNRYRGAMIIVTHDQDLCQQLRLDAQYVLSRKDGLEFR